MTAAVVHLPMGWAETLMANGPGFPEYGTAEWAALADDDRRKVASA